MPACSSENVPRFWSSSPPISRSNSESPHLPGSPLSTSPFLSSSTTTLERSSSGLIHSSNIPAASTVSQIANSSNDPILFISAKRKKQQQQPEQRQQQNHQSVQESSVQGQSHNRSNFLLLKIFYWYIGLVFGILRSILNTIRYAIWAPALWASAWIYVLWVILQLPLTALKWLITIVHTPAAEIARNKRCVLISGGSTVQSVHLARNFYKAGARVVVCELEGLFGLARFSTACSKFYTIPRPGRSSVIQYIKALKDIVQREKAIYYIPVSASNTAYYDALAKPYLEIMGCECFVPRASEVTALDDPLELLRRCRMVGLTTPIHFILRCVEDVSNLYEQNAFATGRYMMLAAGPAGMRDRAKMNLPPTAREFRSQQHEIGENRPWVIIRDPDGEHFITCTTVKDSRLVANVTCRIDEERGLIPEERPEITQWLDRFFNRSFLTRISGHLSFKLAMSDAGELVPLECRVGISLPYVCHTGIHPRLVWTPCRHFSRQNSGIFPTVDRHLCRSDTVTSVLKRPVGETSPHFLGTVLDKRETLFAYWDPLPYCAYYHLQLPFRRIAGAIRAQPAQHNPPLAMVQ